MIASKESQDKDTKVIKSYCDYETASLQKKKICLYAHKQIKNTVHVDAINDKYGRAIN